MANPESPDPATDLVPITNNGEEADSAAPAPEPKLPTRKDASLKEFLGKMDDYAPIVSCLPPLNFFSNHFRSRMRSQTTISPKLAFHPHLRQILVLHVSSPWPLRSLSQISQPTHTNTLEYDLLIHPMRIIRWEIWEPLQDFQSQDNQLPRQVARSNKAEVDL